MEPPYLENRILPTPLLVRLNQRPFNSLMSTEGRLASVPGFRREYFDHCITSL